MNYDPYKKCDDHRDEMREGDGLCPTCNFAVKENMRIVEEGRAE